MVFSYQFTTQIYYMFNNFTQHLTVVATSISPIVRAHQFSNIHLCVLSHVLGLA